MSGVAIPLESRLRYLNRRQAELKSLLALDEMSEDFFMQAQKMGHQIKGNAVTFDFAELTENAKELEIAATQKKSSNVRNLAQKILAQVEHHLSTLV